jgi:hypothetical protein
MRGGLVARIRLAILVLALGSALGLQCDGGEEQTWVALVPDTNRVGTYSLFTVDVLVTSLTPIQAFDLSLQWDPEMLFPTDVAPHPEFDDDGAFFISPRFDFVAGKLDRVVDLRHGGEGTEGRFKIATIQFLSLDNAGSTPIGLTSGGLAAPDGSQPSVTNIMPVTITIEP